MDNLSEQELMMQDYGDRVRSYDEQLTLIGISITSQTPVSSSEVSLAWPPFHFLSSLISQGSVSHLIIEKIIR
ncbi:hypothetical protein J6590_070193 [Homalodisca vitripennis]|nr:hypothetical protein J6590_070193 [Homalodisca vitripennis]